MARASCLLRSLLLAVTDAQIEVCVGRNALAVNRESRLSRSFHRRRIDTRRCSSSFHARSSRMTGSTRRASVIIGSVDLAIGIGSALEQRLSRGDSPTLFRVTARWTTSAISASPSAALMNGSCGRSFSPLLRTMPGARLLPSPDRSARGKQREFERFQSIVAIFGRYRWSFGFLISSL